MDGEGAVSVHHSGLKNLTSYWCYDDESTDCMYLPPPYTNKAGAAGVNMMDIRYLSMFGAIAKLISDPAPVWTDALNECSKVLGRNGIVVVTFWNPDAPDDIFACFYTTPDGMKHSSSMLPEGFSRDFGFSDKKYSDEFEKAVFRIAYR